MNSEQETSEWYRAYYKQKGESRNNILHNAGVLFQHLGFEVSITNSLRMAKINSSEAKILDVGCGSGGGLPFFTHLGFRPENLSGIDILEERIVEGRRKFPNVDFTCGDASSMPYDDGYFDLVSESTMFVQLTDSQMSQKIATEMLRVAKPGGYLLLIDWRYSKPGNSDYLGLSKRRIKKLFEVGSQTKMICQARGALIPPVGRTLSKYVPSFYFMTAAIMPILVGQKCTLLQKRSL